MGIRQRPIDVCPILDTRRQTNDKRYNCAFDSLLLFYTLPSARPYNNEQSENAFSRRVSECVMEVAAVLCTMETVVP